MSDKIKTFTVVIGNAAYTSERPYTMLRFAYTSLLEGHKINIFLVEDGVFVGKKNQMIQDPGKPQPSEVVGCQCRN